MMRANLLIAALFLASCATGSGTSRTKRAVAGGDAAKVAVGKAGTWRNGNSDLPKPGPCGKYKELIEAYSKEHGLEPELVMGVIQVESGYNPKTRSRVGATGLMQLMPRTASHMKCGSDMTDPEENIQCGCRVLKKYLDLYDGNLIYGLSAYNTGPGNTNPSRREGKAPFNFPYVEKVLRWRNVFVRIGCQ